MPTTVALAGLYQANEVIKVILGQGELLCNQLLLIDTLNNHHTTYKFKRKKTIDLSREGFYLQHGKEISYASITDYKAQEDFLLDVRNAGEIPDIQLFDGKNIPLGELEYRMEELPRDRAIYLFCQSGARSKQAYHLLKQKGFSQLHCLKEGAEQLVQTT